MEPLRAPIHVVPEEEEKAMETVPLPAIEGVGTPGKHWGVCEVIVLQAPGS